MFRDEKWLIASNVEDRRKELVILLVKAVQARLNVVFCEIGIESYLSSSVGRSAMVGRGDWKIVWCAVEIGGVIVVEGRDGQQCFRVKGVYPRKVHKGIAFMLAITEPDAWVLRYPAILTDWRVLAVVRVGIIRNLVVVPAQRRHETELVRRIKFETQ